MKYSHYPDIAIQEKREKREEERKRALQRTYDTLNLLSEEVQFSAAYVFGSLIHPYRFKDDSDVDIGFLGLDDKDFFRTIAFLSRNIGRDVDVIQLESHPLKDRIQTAGVMKWTKSD